MVCLAAIIQQQISLDRRYALLRGGPLHHASLSKRSNFDPTMAQTWHRARRDQRPKRRPLDERSLEERAIAYVGRYATTRARLAAYLQRKLTERGWAGAAPPSIDELVTRLAGL